MTLNVVYIMMELLMMNKLEEDDSIPNCMDCLCRTCAHNSCAEGELCTGCNACDGNIIDTEEDCPRNMYEYMGD